MVTWAGFRYLVASLIGLGAAAVILVVASGGPDAPQVHDHDTRIFGVLASEATWALLDQVDTPDLQFERLAPGEVGRVVGDDLAGMVVDAKTIANLGDAELLGIYASGRVVVAFDVERASVLHHARAREAFPDLGRAFHRVEQTDPASDTGDWESPFFSVVSRTAPGSASIGGRETTLEFRPVQFEAVLLSR